jgi:hypothetical protein
VWESCEAVRNTGSGRADEDGNEDGDGEEADVEVEDDMIDATRSNTARKSTGSSTLKVDTMKDARRLYLWPSGLYELVGRL